MQLISRIRPVYLGIVVIAATTAYFALSGSAYLFIYNECLLAALGAIALNFLVGVSGIISLGNAAFMSAGAFATVYATHVGLPFPANVLFGTIFAAIAGFVFGLPAARLGGVYMAFATLSAVIIVNYLGNRYQTHSKAGGEAGFIYNPVFNSLGLDGQLKAWSWLLFGIVAVTLLVTTRLARERSGRALRMIRDHEIVAHTLGIPVVRYKLITFSLASALVGMEGGLLVEMLGSASTASFSLGLTISYLAMVLIGGVDSIAGAVIGAGIVTALPTVVPKILDHFMDNQTAAQRGPGLSSVTYGLLLVLFVATSPYGVAGLIRQLVNAVRTRLRPRRDDVDESASAAPAASEKADKVRL